MSRWGAAALAVSASGAWAGEPPRLAGTIVGPEQRVAVFAMPPGGTLSVKTGETVGDYVVRGIEPGRVNLQHDGQRLVVSIEGAATPPAPADAGGATFGVVLHDQGPPGD